MNIDMIVTDLDNTLLRSDKTISGYTRDVLNRCRARGVRVMFATARPPRTVRRFALGFEPDAIAYHNGALVMDGGRELFQAGISGADARRIMLRLSTELPGVTLSLEQGDQLYANFDTDIVWRGEDCVRTDFSDLPDLTVYKLIVGISSPEDIARIAPLLPDYLYAQPCENTLALIMNRRATKLGGIRDVAAAHGIPMERVAAFGDDFNDIDMLRACGVGVAVDNALPEVKAAADQLCADCDADGVAHWLETNVLGQHG